MHKSMAGSVGRMARNRCDDVRLVQYLLNCVPIRRGGPTQELVIDGVCGLRTLHAIHRFQRARQGAPGGRIDPDRSAFRTLAAFDPYPSQPLPPGYREVPAGQPEVRTTQAPAFRTTVARSAAQRGQWQSAYSGGSRPAQRRVAPW